jgi:hypothetical protein
LADVGLIAPGQFSLYFDLAVGLLTDERMLLTKPTVFIAAATLSVALLPAAND